MGGWGDQPSIGIVCSIESQCIRFVVRRDYIDYMFRIKSSF